MPWWPVFDKTQFIAGISRLRKPTIKAGLVWSFLIHGTRSQKVPQIDCYCYTSMSFKSVYAPPTIGNLSVLYDRPMVYTRDHEPVTRVVEWNNLTTEILGSNPTGVHSLVRFPKACWRDLIMVETAVQVKAGLVWSFLKVTKVPINSFPCNDRRHS